MFQAVSLEGDVEGAKGLAYSAPQLRASVMRVESARLELTAVVEPLRTVSDLEDEAGAVSVWGGGYGASGDSGDYVEDLARMA